MSSELSAMTRAGWEIASSFMVKEGVSHVLYVLWQWHDIHAREVVETTYGARE